VIYRLKFGKREVYLKEAKPLGALTFGREEPVEELGVLEVYGQKVEIGGTPREPFGESSRNYPLIVKAAQVVALTAAGAPIEGALEVKETGRRELLLIGEVLRELLGERALLNFTLEGLLSTFEGERNPHFKELLKGREEETLGELLREGYLARVVGIYFGEVGKEGIEEGAPVFVVREHDNRADPNAVKVLYKDGRKLGYLRRSLAKKFAPIIDEGILLTGRLVRAEREVVVEIKAVGT